MLFLLSLSACASDDYSKPVSTFADTVDKTGSAFVAAQDAWDEAYTDELVEKAVKSNVAVRRYEKGDCAPGAQPGSRCRLAYVEQGIEKGELLDAGPRNANLRAVMAGLVQYVAGLRAITSAGTGAEIDEALANVRGKVADVAASCDALFKQLDAGKKADENPPRICLCTRADRSAGPWIACPR